jgi:predicted metal-dependent enzyme (double-stranded beta helix superfamily)
VDDPPPQEVNGMKASKIAYKPVGLALGAVSGMTAGALFKQAWKMLGHDEDAPDATDEERTWSQVVLAATLQGAIFAATKAVVDRAGATATRRLTGTWPG